MDGSTKTPSQASAGTTWASTTFAGVDQLSASKAPTFDGAATTKEHISPRTAMSNISMYLNTLDLASHDAHATFIS